MRFWWIVITLALILNTYPSSGEEARRVDRFLLQAPAGERYTAINREGVTVLPNGRLVTPLGRQLPTAPHPFGMVLSDDGKVLVTVNGGVGPFSLTVINNPQSEHPALFQIPPGRVTDKKVLPAVFIGAAIDSARDRLYASGGDTGTLVVFQCSTGARLGEIQLNSEAYSDSFPTDLMLSPDHRWLYALDLANYRLVVVDIQVDRVISSVGVGRNPFALVLTGGGRQAYVANMGTFQYSLVETKEGLDKRGLSFPPFGYPSKEAEEGTIAEGRKVPGLGSPNVPEACSVWGVDLSNPTSPTITVRIKTGIPVGEAVGGSSPAALAVTDTTLYVSNSTNDTIEAYDLATHQKRWETLLTAQSFLSHLRGVLPFGLAVSPDGKRLYAAESGINAVAVLEARSGALLGHLPVGWYPARVCLSPDGKNLYVSNAKGYGSGPNGGAEFHAGPEGTYIARLMKGTVSIISVPPDHELAPLTRNVLANNGFLVQESKRPAGHPLPVEAGTASDKIKYVVFVAKENRTFDEVFGDFPGAKGDPSLARFGAHRAITPAKKNASDPTTPPLADVNVMPNHRALAQQFAFSDNFYVESDVSADGHRWLVGVYANHWVETLTAANYGGAANFKRGKAPGRLAFFQANSSLTPEDYLEDGSLWEHLERNRIPFRNYGEGFEFVGADEAEDTKPTGVRLPVNMPMPNPLYENTDRRFPTFNTNIPDQYRMDRFLGEFQEKYLSGREPLPRFIYLYLPNDHGDSARPEKGYPYLESYMADNDLAVGRLVEALSHSPFWKEMAIFITEDDAQGGVDHVDAHRSLVLAISPWIKRGWISKAHLSLASIHKTTYLILGMPYLNLIDAAAADLGDLFTSTPDYTPYQCLPVDSRIFDPAKARDPNDPDYNKAARRPSIPLDSVEEAVRQQEVK